VGKRKRRAFTGEYKAETARLIRESGKTVTCPRPRVLLDDERMCQAWPFSSWPDAGRSLDHLVGAKQQRGRNRQAECLCGLEIDHQLECRGLLDWNVGGPGALEDLVDVEG